MTEIPGLFSMWLLSLSVHFEIFLNNFRLAIETGLGDN
jgi:hypothetical protein